MSSSTDPSKKDPIAWANFRKSKAPDEWNLMDMKIWNNASILKIF